MLYFLNIFHIFSLVQCKTKPKNYLPISGFPFFATSNFLSLYQSALTRNQVCSTDSVLLNSKKVPLCICNEVKTTNLF